MAAARYGIITMRPAPRWLSGLAVFCISTARTCKGQNRRSASSGGRSEAVLVTSSDRPTDREGMSMTMEGDITGIYSREGNLLVSYSYDAWGQNRRSAACGG